MKTMLIVVMLGLLLGVVLVFGHPAYGPTETSPREAFGGPLFDNAQALGSDSMVLAVNGNDEEEDEEEGSEEKEEAGGGGLDRAWEAPKLG